MESVTTTIDNPAGLPGLDRCVHDLGIYANEAIDRFGSAALGTIDLPKLYAPGRLGRGELRAISTLYWCWNVELAVLPSFVEELARQTAMGLMHIDIGQRGTVKLMHYYRRRRDRHTPEERQYRYSILFGAPGSPRPNTEFLPAFQALAKEMASVADSDRILRGSQARCAVLASEVLSVLGPRGAGVTRFDAERILASIQEALHILKAREISQALGGGLPLSLIIWNAQAVLKQQLDPGPHVARARAGAGLLRWISNNLDEIGHGMVNLSPRDQVLNDAVVLTSSR